MIFKKKGSRLPGGGWVAFALACAVGLTGCGGAGDSGSSSATTSGTISGATTGTNTLSLAATAGQALFNDKSLSVSGKQSCATCHVASRAFTADPATDQGLPVPLGGPNMDIPGFRNAPSLMYASLTPAFFLDAGTPTGGFFRDGRASSLDQQAQQPFITPFEMANQDAAEVLSRLQNSPDTLQAFIAAYGTQSLSDPQVALADMGLALAAYETEDPDFHPFTSKFDYWQQGQAQLTAEEQEGLALFNNPGKGKAPTLTAAEIDAVVAFLCTLTDGYDPANPSAYNVPAQCQPTATTTAAAAHTAGN